MQKVLATQQAAMQQVFDWHAAGRDIWALDEAKYLEDMAQFALDVQRRPALSIKLLRAADARIAALHNPKYSTVRKRLAAHIAALEAVPAVDVEGIYLKLQALDTQVERLPLYSNHVKAPQNDSADADKASLGSRVWQSLQKIVILRHHDSAVEPLLGSSERALLNLNMHVLFAQAQWALLHRKPTIYVASLTRLQRLVGRYFVANSSDALAIQKALAVLAKVGIAPSLPDIEVNA